MRSSRILLRAAIAIACALFTTAVLAQSLIPGRTNSGNQQSIVPKSDLAKGQSGYYLTTTAPDGAELEVFVDRSSACPCTSGTPEGEANCGLPADNTNGGCNSTPNVFGSVSCGETICGTIGATGGMRDTDWYNLVLGSAQLVTVSVIMETDTVFTTEILQPACPGVAGANDTQGPCSTASYQFAGSVGTNTIFVAGTSFDNITCGTPYTLAVSCGPLPEADLEIIKTNDADNLLPGDLLTYTLMVTNHGPDAATGVVVQDDLPPSTTYDSDSCGAGPPAGNTWTWNVGNLGVDASASCDLSVRVSQPGEILNFAFASGNESDPDGANNEDDTVVEVLDLVIPTLNLFGLALLVLVLGVGTVIVLRGRGAA